MWIILDAVVILIILITAFISAKRGFVRTIIETVGFVAALVIAFSFSTPLAELTYNKVIEPPVVAAVSENTVDTAENAADAVWEAMPNFLTNNADRFGISKDRIVSVIDESASENVQTVVQNTSQTVFKPIVVKLLGMLYSAIILVVLLFVVKIVARLLNRLFSFSIVGRLNRTLGGVIGLVKGFALAALFCVLIGLIVSFTANGFLFFTHQNIADSYLFGSIINLFI